MVMSDTRTILRSETSQELSRELTALRQRITDNMQEAGEWATGKTAESMVVEIRDEADLTRGLLYGRAFFGALETGSRPWAKPTKRVPKKFANTIQEWIKAKNLDLNAWAVAYTIMHEGSSLYRRGGRSDIYSNEIPVTLDNLAERLSVAYVKHIALNSNL